MSTVGRAPDPRLFARSATRAADRADSTVNVDNTSPGYTPAPAAERDHEFAIVA